MQSKFDDFLEDISRCFIDKDFHMWRHRLLLPFSIITKDGPVLLPTDESVEENFNLYLTACEIMRLDLIDRRAISLEDCKDGTWLGTFETRLLSNAELATAPYVSTGLLRLKDRRFVMSSMLNGRGHHEWTGEAFR